MGSLSWTGTRSDRVFVRLLGPARGRSWKKLLAGLGVSWSVTPMDDKNASLAPRVRGGKSARGGGPGVGRQVVGDYVGRIAGEAAQGVRRVGLRPGVERLFGCEADLIGLVVAQEPVAGSDMARNGMVTLYVAASGEAGACEDVAAPSMVESDSALPARDMSDRAEAPESGMMNAGGVRACRRRRKPGLARRAPQAVSRTLVLPGVEQEGETAETSLAGVSSPAQEWESGEGDFYAPDEGGLDQDDLEAGERKSVRMTSSWCIGTTVPSPRTTVRPSGPAPVCSGAS